MRVPLMRLQKGTVLKNRVPITPQVVQHLQHRTECGYIGAGFLPNSRFAVAEVNTTPADQWVRLMTPGSDPPQYLKLTGGEFAQRFDLA